MNRPAPTITIAKAPTLAAVVKRPANCASVDAMCEGSNGRGTETCYKRSMGRTWVARGSSSRAGSALAALACAHLLACSSTPSAGNRGELFSFPEVTQAPLGVAQVPASLERFFNQCTSGDAALARVAERFARRQAQ